MTDSVVEVENLSKQYRVYAVRQPYKTVREQIQNVWKRIYRTNSNPGNFDLNGHRYFWALQDISFQLHRGEVLGIIGRNGAGKSTLLKVLSRITEPTEGVARVRGKVGSLLEVGTGFHPELSGRENVYLNGAILGMRKQEIDRRFDNIVSFAEIEEFVDTPVKHYSSGMAVRLAFSVAAHLNTEIMLIDEVLAVGDAGFQRKCAALLHGLMQDGRTAILVSHNTGLIRSLCSRAILIEHGRIISDGCPEDVIKSYYQLVFTNLEGYTAEAGLEKQSIFVSSAYLSDAQGRTVNQIACGERMRLNLLFKGEPGVEVSNPKIHLRIYSSTGQFVSYLGSKMSGYQLPPIHDQSIVICEIDALNIVPDEYSLGFIIADGLRVYDEVETALTFTVETADYFGSGDMPEPRRGQVLLKSHWRVIESAGIADTVNSVAQNG